ncbi:MAG: hypothetical protein ACI4TV_08010, partial [Paludibacteraceae bacterium]
QMGIARSRKAAEEAQIVIEIQDAPQLQDPPRPSLQREGDRLVSPIEANFLRSPFVGGVGGGPGSFCGSYIRVVNKADLLASVPAPSDDPEKPVYISARNKEIAPLLARLQKAGEQLTATRNAATISNVRHYEALKRADEAIRRVQEGLDAGVSGEFLSMDLHDCLNALGEVTGQITSDEVLHNVFKHFCIGK